MQLGARHALHVVGRQLAGTLGFECFGIFIGARQEQLVAHADLVEQLPAARAL